ncbi:hypothetical protein RHMOL_Rhmol13G0249100 [Rhododendron molle]|uniref:Uncharacterized protein n=1 Tax=Rhododendron molle TaxID=49168 RepID=A0ACC0LBG1_RHOML|nr:hypothetical protein RHMOL_Rhmol13G0249100 [Rhododendron molle]
MAFNSVSQQRSLRNAIVETQLQRSALRNEEKARAPTIIAFHLSKLQRCTKILEEPNPGAQNWLKT